MTHPAFLAFDTNGLWVGKFEAGYDGATSTAAAQVNSNDSSKIIIKPNVYSWRNITIGNAFKASYDYLRDDESHMMKNTEWGAVAYLSHSIYGTCIGSTCNEIRINNNSAYITGYSSIYDNSSSSYTSQATALGVDGTSTINYFNNISNLSSTTANYTGIYDTSGGSLEYVMGSGSTDSGSSGITNIYSDFFTNSIWNKYYDKYSAPQLTSYNNRILGDATGEMGPFGKSDGYNSSSWYNNFAQINTSGSWLLRSGSWDIGKETGIFAFDDYIGSAYFQLSYRIVLAPTK